MQDPRTRYSGSRPRAVAASRDAATRVQRFALLSGGTLLLLLALLLLLP